MCYEYRLDGPTAPMGTDGSMARLLPKSLSRLDGPTAVCSYSPFRQSMRTKA